MTLSEFSKGKVDQFGDPIPMTVRNAKGEVLADFDMDRYTYPVEGVDEQELYDMEVVGYTDCEVYLEVIVQ